MHRSSTVFPSDGFVFSLTAAASLWTSYLVLSMGPAVIDPAPRLGLWVLGFTMLSVGIVVGVIVLSKVHSVFEQPMLVRVAIMLLILSSVAIIFVRDSGLWMWVYFAVGTFQSAVPALAVFLTHSKEFEYLMSERVAEAVSQQDNAFAVGSTSDNDLDDELDIELQAPASASEPVAPPPAQAGPVLPKELREVDFEVASIRVSDALSLFVVLQAGTPYTLDFRVAQDEIHFFTIELILVQILVLLAGSKFFRRSKLSPTRWIFSNDMLRPPKTVTPLNHEELAAEGARLGVRYMMLGLISLSWGICFCILSQLLATPMNIYQLVVFRVLAVVGIWPTGLIVRNKAFTPRVTIKIAYAFITASIAGYAWLAFITLPVPQIVADVFGFIGAWVTLVVLQVLVVRAFIDAAIPHALICTQAAELANQQKPLSTLWVLLPYQFTVSLVVVATSVLGFLFYKLSAFSTASLAFPLVMAALAGVRVLYPSSG